MDPSLVHRAAEALGPVLKKAEKAVNSRKTKKASQLLADIMGGMPGSLTNPKVGDNLVEASVAPARSPTWPPPDPT